jgi:alpha-L-rhamnosidase
MVESGTVTVDEEKPKWKNHIIQGIHGNYKGYPYEQLEECLSDEISQLSYFASSSAPTRSMTQGRYSMFDFGRTVTGFPYIELNIDKDAVVYLTFDELVTKTDQCTLISPLRDNCVNVIKYSLKAGEYKLIAFEASSMRFVNVIFLQGEGQIKRFGLVAYENPDVIDSAFETGNEDVDLIVSAARNTLAQNSVDILTDCPSRERAGWLCDSFFSGRAEFFFTGKNITDNS